MSSNFTRYHKDLGTLVSLDVYSDEESASKVKQRLLDAIDDGFIGPYRVSSDGFEFHVVRGLSSCVMLFVCFVPRMPLSV